MLAAIISLLQDQAQPQPPRPRPTVKIDRGGGGGYRYPAFEVQDFIMAARSFREIPGEDSLARAVRRAEHIGRELEQIHQLRRTQDSAMAQGLLLGAELQRRVYEEQAREVKEIRAKVVAQVELMRAEQAAANPVVEHARETSVVPGLVVGGLVLTLALVAVRRLGS